MYYNISPKLILFIVLVIVFLFVLSYELTVLTIICGIILASLLYDWYDTFSHVDYFEDDCGYHYDRMYGEYCENYYPQNPASVTDYSKYQPKANYKPYVKPIPLKIEADIVKHVTPNMSFELKTDKDGQKRKEYKKLLEMSEDNLATYIMSLVKKDGKVETEKPTAQTTTFKPVVSVVPQNNQQAHHAPLLLEAPKPTQSLPTITPKVAEPPKLHTFIVMQNTNYLGDIRERIYNTIITHLRSLYLAKNVMELVLDNIAYIDVISKGVDSAKLDITHEIVIFVKDFKVFHKYEINFDIIIDKIINLQGLKLSVVMEKLQTKTISEYYKERG